jgi:hypothetical protein
MRTTAAAPIPTFPRFAEEGVTAKPQNFDAIALDDERSIFDSWLRLPRKDFR